MAQEQIPIEVILILARYSRDMRQATKDASALDTALTSLMRQAKKTGAALDKLGGKIAIDLDTSALSRAESLIRGIPDIVVNVTADTSALSRAESSIASIDGMSPEIDIQVDSSQLDRAQTVANTIDSLDPKVDVQVTSNAPSVETDIKALDDINLADIQLKADISAALATIEDLKKQLEELQKQGRIQILLQAAPIVGGVLGGIGGAAGGAAGFISNTFIDPLLEVDRVLGTIEAKTGQIIPDADKLISDIFKSNMAESRTEIGSWIAQFVQFQGVTENTSADIIGIASAADIMGKDFTETLRAVDKLVSTGLVANVSEANDLLVSAFQQGGDRADDLIDTLVEYPILFQEMGISGAGAVDLMLQSLEAGTFNTDKLADTFKELGIRLDEAVGSKAGATFDALQMLGQQGVRIDLAEFIDVSRVSQLIEDGVIKDGILNPMQLAKLQTAGEISGTEFASGMTAAVNTAVEEGLVSEGGATFNLREIFGTPLEDLGTDLFRGLDFGQALEAQIDTGATDRAASALYGSLDQTVQQTGQLIQENILDNLGGVDAILDKLNEKFTQFNTLLMGGEGIPESLEIVLESPGLANTLRTFESAIGNFLIEFLGMIGDMAESFGQAETAARIRGEVTRLGEQQLAFDLQIAGDNEKAISDAIKRATGRGVADGMASDAANTAVQELLERGNVAGARELVRELGEQTITLEFETGDALDPNAPRTKQVIPFEMDIDVTPQEIEAKKQEILAQFKLKEGEAIFNVSEMIKPVLDVSESEALVNEAINQLVAQANTAIAEGDYLSAIPLLQEAGDEYTGVVTELANTLVPEFSDAFNQAVTHGDWRNVLPIAEILESTGNVDPATLDGIRARLIEQFNSAFAAGNQGEAVDIANLLGDEGLLEQANTLQDVTDKARRLSDMNERLTERQSEMQRVAGEGAGTFKTLTDEGITPAATATQGLDEDTGKYVENLQGNLEIAKVTWFDYKTFLESLVLPQPLSDGSGAAPPHKPFASGGIASPGMSLVGERGAELVSSNTALAVLNNQSTSALIQGVQMALSGMGGGSRNTTINVNIINNNANSAAGRASGDSFNASIRGFRREAN